MRQLKHREETDDEKHQHPVAYDLSYNEGTALHQVHTLSCRRLPTHQQNLSKDLL